MVQLRRLLSGVLAIALAQFGAMATAPAHAHEGDHGVPVIALDAAQTSEAAHGHGHSDHAAAAIDTLPAPTPDEPRNDATGSETVHVHGCAQFAPVEAGSVGLLPSEVATLAWPIGDVSMISYSWAPPLRPPRTSL